MVTDFKRCSVSAELIHHPVLNVLSRFYHLRTYQRLPFRCLDHVLNRAWGHFLGRRIASEEKIVMRADYVAGKWCHGLTYLFFFLPRLEQEKKKRKSVNDRQAVNVIIILESENHICWWAAAMTQQLLHCSSLDQLKATLCSFFSTLIVVMIV